MNHFYSFGWSKRKAPLSRSGRVIKGRGVFVSIINFHYQNKYIKTNGINLCFHLCYSVIEHHHVLAADPKALHHHIGSKHKSES